MEQNEKLNCWALVELMGHQKIAGLIAETTIAGGPMLRIDVPETAAKPAFTRFLGTSAIYAINPCTEELAKKCAEALELRPISIWEVDREIEKRITTEVNHRLAEHQE